MSRAITNDEFAELFRTFEHSAFRLETQPAYRMTTERKSFGFFLCGSPQPPSELPWWQSWLDQIRDLTAQGKKVARVRFVDDPPTSYQRWEMWATPYHREAGEDIRYLPRNIAHVLGLVDGDWWLFDDSKLVVMGFTERGEVDGKTLITDPEIVRQHRSLWGLAASNATTEDIAA